MTPSPSDRQFSFADRDERGVRSRNYEGHRLREEESRTRHYLAELDGYLS